MKLNFYNKTLKKKLIIFCSNRNDDIESNIAKYKRLEYKLIHIKCYT